MNAFMITQRVRDFASLSVLMLTFPGSVNASNYPLEMSIAFVEESQIACTKAQPEAAGLFKARKELLYAEAPEKVKAAKASRDYAEARKWARGVLRSMTGPNLAEACEEFLTKSDLALNQEPHASFRLVKPQ